ncbi:MAG: hypothetical protein B6D64_14175 [Bacteroidetes bacterium 4484_276]|nr:MAG: hypothetical protein B6D64_14175 [Bacteroidetes bacterium 4484_276]
MVKKLEATTYGTNATKNTIGQITELADQSGVTLFDEYDFKGNLLSLSKQLCQDYKNTIDWKVAKCDHLKRLKHSSFLPNVFTQYGVLQAANVLNSDRAILMGNRIIEVFIRMQEMLSTHKEILQKIEQLIEKDTEQDKKIMLIFEYLKQLEQNKQEQFEYINRKRLGFKRPGEQ